MKVKEYTDAICKEFCTFYKEGKEDLLCGSYRFLKENLTMRELRALSALLENTRKSSAADSSLDEEIKELVCNKCAFLRDGCDFRESRSGPPCGGYILLTKIIDPKIAHSRW